MTSVVMEGVAVTYGRTVAVRDVTLDVAEGEWFALLGPNGAGKSTLLRTIVAGPISTGTVSVGDMDVHHSTSRQRALAIAYVPQRPTFPKGMSVFDYVLLGRTPHMGTLAAENRHDVDVVWGSLASLDLTDFAERDVAALSGGETQRVSMARVIAQEAAVLVLDEATAALDVARQHQVLELIDRVRHDQGITVVSAMHDLTAAAQFCDRVGLMDQGQLLGVGAPKDIMTEDLLHRVFEPTVRVIEVEGSQVIVSMRDKEFR
jgi:iron complex transport system ATP-binding protein